ncbi:hypothetical protein N7510_004581 [Penicillium lagena]|uniref:uncharacterized protein n=1 Tax=Penicillium lagena TaxID=94218 RepID=UPI002540B990|nr:uncharacterized protein N7510_004581 [Penicillium lagena]KAJ5620597.1 hypothetical protein N7510_004581 [Penicillium lagena]
MDERVKTEAGRKRGRPRTNTNEEELLDRRRKQLRRAQQAYRKRKENTIDTLRNRVDELEGGIEQISHSFLTFSNLLLESDLLGRNAHVTLAFQKITQQCVSLARTGCDDLDEGTPVKTADFIEDNGDQSQVQSNSYSSTSPNGEEFLELYGSLIKRSGLSVPSTPPPPSQNQTLSYSPVMAPSSCRPFIEVSQLSSPASTISPASVNKEEWRSFAQCLIKVCCQNGYQLLVNTPDDDVKIKSIFGPLSLPMERNVLISYFWAGMQDHTGDLVDQMATVLTPPQSKRSSYTSEQLGTSKSKLPVIPEGDEWLDASGVQRLLCEKGICIHEKAPPFSSPSLNFSLDVENFAELLAAKCICFGRGPVFRRQNVEASLRVARSKNPWSVFNPLLSSL